MADKCAAVSVRGEAGGGCWPDIVAAARSCVGTKFRRQGRTRGLGLDCVGVALVAAAASELGPVQLPSYAIGGDHEAIVESVLAGLGCARVVRGAAGDIMVCAPATGRRHLAIVTPRGAVHAHAGLGRVVEGPIDPDWTIIGAWRLPGAR